MSTSKPSRVEETARDPAHRQRIVDDHHERLLGLHDGHLRHFGRDALGVGIELRHVGALRELDGVDDQHDLAVAEHRRAGDSGHPRELRADVLHDDFLVADHLVDVDSRDVLAAAQQQHRIVARRLRNLLRIAEEARQVVERIAQRPGPRRAAARTC